MYIHVVVAVLHGHCNYYVGSISVLICTCRNVNIHVQDTLIQTSCSATSNILKQHCNYYVCTCCAGIHCMCVYIHMPSEGFPCDLVIPVCAEDSVDQT